MIRLRLVGAAAIFLFLSFLPALGGTPSAAALNVNCRYTVEGIELPDEYAGRISTGLRADLKRLIGEKLDGAALEELAQRVRKEVHARAVSHKVVRGATPEHVRVVFEIAGGPKGFEMRVPQFLYHAKQGWSAAVEGTARVAGSSFTLGLASDADELPERYAGVYARYEKNRIGSDRVKLRFEFDSYHNQWNRSTLAAAGDSIYRTRQNFEPQAVLALARWLTWSAGASFQRFQKQFPAARTEASNAVVSTLRFHRRPEASGPYQHDMDAGYTLRAATRALDSDYSYVRHQAGFRYTLKAGRSVLIEDVRGGFVSGAAPIFDRFVLGTASTLRGWNKYDLNPVGGNRMVHNTVEYRYRVFEIFYDTGSVWNRGEEPVARHSIGVGLREGSFSLAVAFPVKNGRADPVFMVGMNY